MKEEVVLVNAQGDAIGTMEKLEAHKKGLLHLAFSVLLCRETKEGREFLLQKRAECKYHSKGKWSNTCCSHPRVNEAIESAGVRRLAEEIGITGIQAEQFDNLGWFIVSVRGTTPCLLHSKVKVNRYLAIQHINDLDNT